MLGQRARLVIEYAQRPDRQAIGGAQHRAGVEAEAFVPHAQRVVRHAFVLQRIGDLDEIAFEDDMAAQAGVDRGRAHPEPDLGLEPLPSLVDEIDNRYGRFANRRGDLDQFVEIALALGIEDTVAVQFAQPRFFLRMERRFHIA